MNNWSSMQERVESYLQARRRVGYILRIEGAQLLRFAQYADQKGHSQHITIDLAVAWANASQKSRQIGRARRLEVVRSLAKFCVIFEPEAELPPAHRRQTPHIYNDCEIDQQLETANELQPKHGLQPRTVHCLLGLLVSTGLRISEALRLNRNDVDLHRQVILVRRSKFRKSRYVPMHQTVCEALSRYAAVRDQQLPIVQNPAFHDAGPVNLPRARKSN